LQSKRKIRIQLEDNDGDKYNLSLEGSLSKEKMLKVFTLLDSLDSTCTNATNTLSSADLRNNNNSDKLGDKLWNIIENEVKNLHFTSTDILKIYNQVYRESTQLSIVSTYLTRFFMKNKLSRTKHGKEWIYTINSEQTTQRPSISPEKFPLAYKNNAFIQNYEKPSTVYDLHQ
jgi:hypothetical protein